MSKGRNAVMRQEAELAAVKAAGISAPEEFKNLQDAGVFVRSCSKSRGWVIRSLSSRKLVLFRNAPVVRDPNTPHAQLALNDDFIGRHGSFGPSPGAYRASARALFATHLR